MFFYQWACDIANTSGVEKDCMKKKRERERKEQPGQG